MGAVDGPPDSLVIQATFELAGLRGEQLLPPGLTPTSPTLFSVVAWQLPDDGSGAATVLMTRISCRNGIRARALATGGVIDAAPERVAELSGGWGLPASPWKVRLDRHYDAVRIVVTDGERTLLDVESVDPTPLRPGDVQHVVTLCPQVTASGPRLAQVDWELDAQRAERARPKMHRFVAEAWGDARLRPAFPVAATVEVGTFHLPPVRFSLALG